MKNPIKNNNNTNKRALIGKKVQYSENTTIAFKNDLWIEKYNRFGHVIETIGKKTPGYSKHVNTIFSVVTDNE